MSFSLEAFNRAQEEVARAQGELGRALAELECQAYSAKDLTLQEAIKLKLVRWNFKTSIGFRRAFEDNC